MVVSVLYGYLGMQNKRDSDASLLSSVPGLLSPQSHLASKSYL